MGTFLLALGLVICLMAAMAIGVIFGRRPIAGTCGGLNNMGSKGECEICGGNPNKCEESAQPAADLSYDASRAAGRD
jgi:hypothetical protein